MLANYFVSIHFFLLGLAACIINFVNTSFTAIYVGIIFLDTTLNFGQGLMTFAIFGLESQYVFAPLLKWFKNAGALMADPEREYNNNMEGYGNAKLHVTLKFVRWVSRKRQQMFRDRRSARGTARRNARVPKISDALPTPEHVMLNICQY